MYELEYPIIPKLKPITAKFIYIKYFDVDNYVKYCNSHKRNPSQEDVEKHVKSKIVEEIYNLDTTNISMNIKL